MEDIYPVLAATLTLPIETTIALSQTSHALRARVGRVVDMGECCPVFMARHHAWWRPDWLCQSQVAHMPKTFIAIWASGDIGAIEGVSRSECICLEQHHPLESIWCWGDRCLANGAMPDDRMVCGWRRISVLETADTLIRLCQHVDKVASRIIAIIAGLTTLAWRLPIPSRADRETNATVLSNFIGFLRHDRARVRTMVLLNLSPSLRALVAWPGRRSCSAFGADDVLPFKEAMGEIGGDWSEIYDEEIVVLLARSDHLRRTRLVEALRLHGFLW